MKNTARFKCGSCQYMLRDCNDNITHCSYDPDNIMLIKSLDYCHKKIDQDKILQAEQENKMMEQSLKYNNPDLGLMLATLDILTRNKVMKGMLK